MKRIIVMALKKGMVLFIIATAMISIGWTTCSARITGQKHKEIEKYYVYSNSTGSLSVKFNSNGTKITLIKSDNKNLKVKLTHQCDTDFEIEYYAKKVGNYTINITLKTKSGEIIEKSIELVAKKYPIKKALFGNEKIAMSGVHYTSNKNGELSVKMKKGYKIKKIELGTKKGGNRIVYKIIKNNKRISLGKLYKLYPGAAVIKISYMSPNKSKGKLYLHIYKI